MTVVIDGMTFTGFPGFDRQSLERLGYKGRVEWLKHRVDLVFRDPLKMILQQEHENYVWLCVTSLLCSTIEALAPLEFTGDGMERFTRFVHKYCRKEWRLSRLRLDDPFSGRRVARRPAEHLYKFFRCGLAHSFCVEWGGLLHREDGAPKYFYKYRARISPKLYALGIVPRELAEDVLGAIDKFFADLPSAEQNTRRRRIFDARFERVFLQKDDRPVP